MGLAGFWRLGSLRATELRRVLCDGWVVWRGCGACCSLAERVRSLGFAWWLRWRSSLPQPLRRTASNSDRRTFLYRQLRAGGVPAGGDVVLHGFGHGHWALPGHIHRDGHGGGRCQRHLTSLSASFTIYSPSHAVLVTGTTTASSGEWCQSTSSLPGTAVFADPAYQARSDRQRQLSDQGTSNPGVSHLTLQRGTHLFYEAFTSSLTNPVISCRPARPSARTAAGSRSGPRSRTRATASASSPPAGRICRAARSSEERN